MELDTAFATLASNTQKHRSLGSSYGFHPIRQPRYSAASKMSDGYLPENAYCLALLTP